MKESIIIRAMNFFKRNWLKIIILIAVLGISLSGIKWNFGAMSCEKQGIDIYGK